MSSTSEYENILAALVDVSTPFNVTLFDDVVNKFYATGNSDLNTVIHQFSSHPDSWLKVHPILSESNSAQAKIISLGILETTIRTRWNTLPRNQCTGIKNFIMNLILEISSDEARMRKERTLLSKLNVVLIQIVKCDWPHNWPNLITELVESSKASQTVCTNNMQLLLLLSEEVFDYSREQMTTEKITVLKSQLNAEFANIFSLCDYVLDNSTNSMLLVSTLRTLLRFLKWIPLEFIFGTQLIEKLSVKFFPVPVFQNLTLQCLSEIAHITFHNEPDKHAGLFIGMINQVMETVYKTIPIDADLSQLYEKSNNQAQQFLLHLATFITEFLLSHLSLLERQGQPVLLSSLSMLLRLSLIEGNLVIFNICLEFWSLFLKDIYRSEQASLNPTAVLSLNSQPSARIRFYEETLANLRQVMILRMAKPDEVLVVVDELGNVNRERLDNTETTTLYLTMRETFVYLTYLDSRRTMDTVCDQLNTVINDTKWNPNALNRLCWAIGSISKALNEAQEKRFLSTVIKALLGLVDKQQKKDDKAIVAANIMYVVGQYPRFLRNHYSFLRAVVAKLFQFMHEKHPGVQDMAVDTFLTICQRCKGVIIKPNDGSTGSPLLQETLQTLPEHTSDLERTQLYTFYEAVAHIISAEGDVATRDQMLFSLMQTPNETWMGLIKVANEGNMAILQDNKNLELIDSILKTNCRVASALKAGFTTQISRLYMEMLVIYRLYSAHVSSQIQAHGENVTRTVTIRMMRSVKKEILKLCTIFFENATQQDGQLITQKFVPELLTTVLADYAEVVPVARDAETLLMFTALIRKFPRQMEPHVNTIIVTAFSITLEMITKNFEDFPEHRKGLYRLLSATVDTNISILFQLPPAQFTGVMDSIFWAMKHYDREIQELGLGILESLLTQVNKNNAVSNQFYQSYLIRIVNEVLELLTDTFHRSSFTQHCVILAILINQVQMNHITIQLDPSHPTNSIYLKEYIRNLLATSFVTVTPQQVEAFVTSLFSQFSDASRFRLTIHNFLIQLKEFAQHIEQMQGDLQQYETMVNQQQQPQQQ